MSGDIKYLVLFSYEGQAKDELSISEGDIVSNVLKSDCGWWHGCLGSREGVFPENHVRVLQGADDRIGMSSSLNYVVTYDYKPVKKDELELAVGEVVEKIGELEPGWWKGISRAPVPIMLLLYVMIVLIYLTMLMLQKLLWLTLLCCRSMLLLAW